MIMRTGLFLGSALMGALTLAGCDNGQSAVETRDRADVSAAPAAAASSETSAMPASAPVEKARWTSNRRNTAAENIQRLYERNGSAFDARSAEDYVDKAHTFIARPPAGTETFRRANGDTLYYHAPSNTFMVATADGTPRTMFKPDNGPAYWEQQKAREASRGGD